MALLALSGSAPGSGEHLAQRVRVSTLCACSAAVQVLLWAFMGVAIAADVFMVAIEVITSKETTRVYTVNQTATSTASLRRIGASALPVRCRWEVCSVASRCGCGTLLSPI